MSESILIPHLADAMVRVTEKAAIAAETLAGRGDEKAADAAAVDAMRTAFNQVNFKGRVVIGEGERDEAPMLYIGEEVGTGNGPEIDIALDPLEGTTLTAKAMSNALAVLAIAPRGGLLFAPDTYMEKIAIGPGYEQGVIDLDATPAENITAMAKAKGVDVSAMTACVLDRPRHAEIIESLRGRWRACPPDLGWRCCRRDQHDQSEHRHRSLCRVRRGARRRACGCGLEMRWRSNAGPFGVPQ